MKKISIIAVLLVQFCCLLSNPIDNAIAEKVAQRFISNKRPGSNTVLNIISEKHKGQNSFYIVNFEEGGWVLVSAHNTTIPVICYSLVGTYRSEDPKPPAFSYLIDSYKETISKSIGRNSPNTIAQKKWDELLSVSSLKSTFTYTPGNQLLNVWGRGHIQWSQERNWAETCEPKYNEYYPERDNTSCYCDNVPAGCGPVAMGQIMWYWKWPKTSTFGTYDWDIMPSAISSGTQPARADEVAKLLYDCDVVNVSHLCAGTMSTVNRIRDAFIDHFGYENVKKHEKNDWLYPSAWGDLIRSEIDNGRPVLYRGDKRVVTTFSRHIFVLDGYDASDPDFFWFNFGWGVLSMDEYNTSRHYLNDISPDDKEYNELQMAIVGISPTYPEMDINIYDVSYSYVTDVKTESAEQNIILPASGKNLTIANGGDYLLTAGNSITLQSGFKTELGGKFSAQINPAYQNLMEISVAGWPANFNPNGNGVDDELCYFVENADSWEFEAINLAGGRVFQSAGSIDSNPICVWDGSGITISGHYTCIIRFKNSFGRAKEKTMLINVIF